MDLVEATFALTALTFQFQCRPRFMLAAILAFLSDIFDGPGIPKPSTSRLDLPAETVRFVTQDKEVDRPSKRKAESLHNGVVVRLQVFATRIFELSPLESCSRFAHPLRGGW